VDEIYQQAIVEPLRWLGRKFYQIDTYVVDGFVWLVGFVPQLFGFTLKLTTQRGSLQGYAATMLLAVVVILLCCSFRTRGMPDTKLTLDDGLGLALIAVLALPILGAIICAMVRGAKDARWVALVVSLICFVVTIPLLLNYRSLQPLSLGEISSTHFNFNFHIGVDSISIWLLALTTF